MKKNRQCIICKHCYSYCSSCAADANKPTWMAIFCGQNCKDIYTTLDDFRDGRISKENAKAILDTLDLSPIEKLPKNFQEIFNEIMVKEEIITEEIQESIALNELENNNENIVENVEENKVKEIKKPRTRKAKNE